MFTCVSAAATRLPEKERDKNNNYDLLQTQRNGRGNIFSWTWHVSPVRQEMKPVSIIHKPVKKEMLSNTFEGGRDCQADFSDRVCVYTLCLLSVNTSPVTQITRVKLLSAFLLNVTVLRHFWIAGIKNYVCFFLLIIPGQDELLDPFSFFLSLWLFSRRHQRASVNWKWINK